MEYWKIHKYILFSRLSGWYLTEGSEMIIRNREVVTPANIPTEGWKYSISTGSGLQWFPDIEMVVEVVHPTPPGAVVGWIIFTVFVSLLVFYLYLRFYKKKSIPEFCEEARAFLVSMFGKVGVIVWSY